MTTERPDRGARALAERLSDLWLTGGTSSDWAVAILANGAVFLPDAAELERLRTALTQIAAMRPVGPFSFATDELADAQKVARAALEPEGSARDGG